MAPSSLLGELSALLAREVELDTLLRLACEHVAQALSADRATLWLVDAERQHLTPRVSQPTARLPLRQPLSRGVAGWVARTGEVVRVDDVVDDPRFDPSVDQATGYSTRSMLVAPVRERDDGPVRGVLQLLNHRDGPFSGDDERRLSALGLELGRALALTTLRSAEAAQPGLTLRGPFNRIVGRSAAMERLYGEVVLAARSDASVLLRGETGTGKGLFARAIHVNSARQSGPFVTVDCATLPSGLLESELFGHERGAFTGAERRVRGKVELAHGGTLFLDELGELSLEAQAKLLRLLQERSFERVGGRETLSADVRVLSATHRELERRVREGSFREDLYYRVRVVELRVPTLRERGAAEIMALARHFAERSAQRYGRPPPSFAPSVVAALTAHEWPGNVRELEHWVESAVVMSPDGELRAESLRGAPREEPPGAPRGSGGGLALPLTLSLEQATARYARAVVDACGGNQSEAARRLDVSRNTLARWLRR